MWRERGSGRETWGKKAVKGMLESMLVPFRVLSTRLFLVFMVVCDWNILSIELQILMMFEALLILARKK
jgi:hypothetical protein